MGQGETCFHLLLPHSALRVNGDVMKKQACIHTSSCWLYNQEPSKQVSNWPQMVIAHYQLTMGHMGKLVNYFSFYTKSVYGFRGNEVAGIYHNHVCMDVYYGNLQLKVEAQNNVCILFSQSKPALLPSVNLFLLLDINLQSHLFISLWSCPCIKYACRISNRCHKPFL